MKTAGRIVAGIFIFQIIVSIAAVGADPKEYVRSILSQNVHPGEPHKDEWIRVYSKRTGVSVNEIGKILVLFIEDKSLELFIRLEAIYIIGELRIKEALPVLKDIIRSENKSFRSSAVSAIVRIGDEGLIDFAREVVNNRQLYRGFDRFTLYDQLSYYLHDTSSRKAEKRREDVRKFFSDAAGKETNNSCLLVIDRELGKTDDNYKKSYEREEVLKKLESSKAERYKKYASDQLGKLRKLPKKIRTHVSIGKNREK